MESTNVIIIVSGALIMLVMAPVVHKFYIFDPVDYGYIINEQAISLSSIYSASDPNLAGPS